MVWRNGAFREKLPYESCWPRMGLTNANAQDDVQAGGIQKDQSTSTVASHGLIHFGSAGRLLPLPIEDTTLAEVPLDTSICIADDPGDRWAQDLPPHDASNPVWTPPCIVPNSAWARGQYVYTMGEEVGGYEMGTVLKVCMDLIRCPVR